MQPLGPDGVFEDRGRLYTESARPGFRVYGERLVSSKGTEWVVCVEFAPRMFRELVRNSEGRPMMMPVLGDATKPEEYAMFAERVDTVYQDVAQKHQADILCDNMDAFNAQWGMVAVKARSEDVTAPPERIFEQAEARIREKGYRIVDSRSLEPYEKDHRMIVARRA